MFLGVPFNIASYALLTHMVADLVGLDVGDFVWTGGDCHVYDNHVDQVAEQLDRDPFPLPKLVLSGEHVEIGEFDYKDLAIENYQHHPAISGAVAV